MLPSTVIRLANEFSNIIGVKEAAGDIVQAMKIIQGKPNGFLVISGDDMITLAMVLAGGSGVISVIGQGFPKDFSQMVRLGLERKVDQANELHYKIADVTDLIFEQGNPAGIKQVFTALGLAENTVRLPLVAVNEDLASRLNEFANTIQ
jgi:4-hydroxy-tetrahydrodipicolinate synthase